MSNKPVSVVPIHPHLRPHLRELYENNSIFDQFRCAASPAGSHVISGSYDG